MNLRHINYGVRPAEISRTEWLESLLEQADAQIQGLKDLNEELAMAFPLALRIASRDTRYAAIDEVRTHVAENPELSFEQVLDRVTFYIQNTKAPTFDHVMAGLKAFAWTEEEALSLANFIKEKVEN